MNIYFGWHAKSLFDTGDIPSSSVGVFESNDGSWVYWFTDGGAYDSGSAETEEEALRKAKNNFR